jgi:hypothetical protein
LAGVSGRSQVDLVSPETIHGWSKCFGPNKHSKEKAMLINQFDASSDSGATSSDTINTDPTSDSDINAAIQSMDDAFKLSTKTNLLITAHKTRDEAANTASQQRPS